MKRITGLVVGLGLVSVMSAAPSVADVWSKTYSPPREALKSSIKLTPDGGYVIAGSFREPPAPTNYGQYDGLLAKIAADGSVQWSKRLAKPYNEPNYAGEVVNDLVVTADGGYVIAGSTGGVNNNSNPRAWIAKLDANGNFIWQYGFGAGPGMRLHAIAQTDDDGDGAADDGYIAVGESSGSRTSLTVKLDPSGAVTWARSIGGSSIGHAVTQTSDGGFVLVASSFVDTSRSGYLIVKYDSLGTTQWLTRMVPVGAGGSGTSFPNSIWETADQGLMVVGTADFNPTGSLNQDGWFIKLSVGGTVEWQRRFEGPNGNGGLIRDASPTADGGILAVGELSNNVLLLRLDALGNTVLQRSYGGGQYDYALSGVETPDGGYILTANSASFYQSAPVRTDIWTIKLDATADIAFLPTLGNVRMTVPSVPGSTVDVPAEYLNPGVPWVENLTLTPTTSVSSDVTLTTVTRSQ